MDKNRLKKIAKGIRSGKVTWSMDVAVGDTLQVFRGMRDVTLGQLDDWENQGVHSIFEWNDKAAEEDDDGNPVFDSCQLMHMDEHEFVESELERLKKAAERRKKRKKGKVKK